MCVSAEIGPGSGCGHYRSILCVSLRRLVPVVAAVTIGVFYVCLCGDWSR